MGGEVKVRAGGDAALKIWPAVIRVLTMGFTAHMSPARTLGPALMARAVITATVAKVRVWAERVNGSWFAVCGEAAHHTVG